MRPVIERCLSKEPRNRWASIGDVRWALDELKKPADLPPQAVRTRHLPWLAAAAILVALTALGAMFVRTKPSQPLLQMEITAPKGTRFGPVGLGQLAISPNGLRLAAIATGKDGKRRLWLRSLDGAAAVALAGTEDVSLYPFWSPDSRWVGFSANGKLQKIDVIAGGPPQVICECASAYTTWNSADTILFATRDEPVQRVSASGGSPTPVFGFDAVNKETREGGPCFLPDGKHFLYGSFGTRPGSVLASLDGQTRRFLFETRESPAIYAPNPAGGGWQLYVDNGQLFARPFEPGKGQLTGAAAFVADAVAGVPARRHAIEHHRGVGKS